MTNEQWTFFNNFKNEFTSFINNWNFIYDELKILQKEASKKDTPEYNLELPLVYNTDLDSITQNSIIKVIVVGDNPGKDEQLKINSKYLVGQAGKLGNNFFKNSPELDINFRKNVIILNKTPIHTAKTNHLNYLIKNGSSDVIKCFYESQKFMAEKTALLQQIFNIPLWLIGYSELKEKKLFTYYKETLINSYKKDNSFLPQWNNLLVFQHFSMNRFTIDLNNFRKSNSNQDLQSSLYSLGTFHKNEIFK